MVETSWTGDTRVERQSEYVCIIYVELWLLPLLYSDDALMIQLGKVALNKSNTCSMEGISSSCSTLGGLAYVRRTVMAAVGGQG